MTSPLSLADSDSLTLLFESDPLKLDDDQILRAIQELRRRRSEFASQEAAKSLAPKRTRQSVPSLNVEQSVRADTPTSEINFEDL